MPLHWRYLGLVTLLCTGWIGATAVSWSHPEGEPLADRESHAPQLTLRKSTPSLPHPAPALQRLDDAEFLAQLPHPPAALETATRAEPPLTSVAIPAPSPMAEDYQSLVDRPAADPLPPPPPRVHRIIEGDTLPKIAARYLGAASRSREIFEANRDKLEHPDILPLGVDLRIPAEESVR